MSIASRFKSLTTWNKLGVIGALASIVAIPLAIALWKMPPAVTKAESQPPVSIGNTTILAQNDSVAAGRDINISKLVSAINRNEEFLTAIRSSQRKWQYLDPLLTEYQTALNNIDGINIANCSAKTAIVTAATDSIAADLNSFTESVEAAHRHSEDVPEIDTVLEKLHLIRARVTAIQSLFRSLETLSNKFEIAAAGVGSRLGQENYITVREQVFAQRDEILKDAREKIAQNSVAHDELRTTMATIKNSQNTAKAIPE